MENMSKDDFKELEKRVSNLEQLALLNYGTLDVEKLKNQKDQQAEILKKLQHRWDKQLELMRNPPLIDEDEEPPAHG